MILVEMERLTCYVACHHTYGIKNEARPHSYLEKEGIILESSVIGHDSVHLVSVSEPGREVISKPTVQSPI